MKLNLNKKRNESFEYLFEINFLLKNSKESIEIFISRKDKLFEFINMFLPKKIYNKEKTLNINIQKYKDKKLLDNIIIINRTTKFTNFYSFLQNTVLILVKIRFSLFTISSSKCILLN
jgi:hypothetical protein